MNLRTYRQNQSTNNFNETLKAQCKALYSNVTISDEEYNLIFNYLLTVEKKYWDWNTLYDNESIITEILDSIATHIAYQCIPVYLTTRNMTNDGLVSADSSETTGDTGYSGYDIDNQDGVYNRANSKSDSKHNSVFFNLKNSVYLSKTFGDTYAKFLLRDLLSYNAG